MATINFTPFLRLEKAVALAHGVTNVVVLWILKCEVIRCPTRKAKRVNLLWEFNNLECSSSVVDPCLLSRAQRSISQLTSLRGLVWVPWPILPQHSSFRHLVLYFWQGGASSTPTKTLKAVVVASGWIYPSRSCSQVELPQCGCSRKLVWYPKVWRWFDVQLESWPESKTSGCKCPMIKSIQASAAEHNCFSLLWTLVCCAEFNSIYKSTDKFVGVCVSFFGPFCHNTPSWVRYPPHHLAISCSTYGKVVHVLHLPKLSSLALTHSHATKVHAGASYQSER